jgi:hypothetical protein
MSKQETAGGEFNEFSGFSEQAATEGKRFGKIQSLSLMGPGCPMTKTSKTEQVHTYSDRPA